MSRPSQLTRRPVILRLVSTSATVNHFQRGGQRSPERWSTITSVLKPRKQIKKKRNPIGTTIGVTTTWPVCGPKLFARGHLHPRPPRAPEPSVAADLQKLLDMTSRERADWLGRLACAEGLEPAPGPSCELDVLGPMALNLYRQPLVMESLPKFLLARYMKAPIALIRMLELFHPELLRPAATPLRVLYLGAGKEEVLDEGRWFALAWELRGLPDRQLQITAVGPELEGIEPSTQEGREPIEIYAPVTTCYPMEMRDAFTVGGGTIDWEDYFDVVVMHNPGFVANSPSWWSDPCWEDLAGFAKIPVIGTSFDATDLAFDRAGLAVSGRVMDRVYWNPTAHVPPGAAIECTWGARIQWAAVMWSTKLDPDIREGGGSQTQRDALGWMKKYHQPLFASRSKLARYFAGWGYICPMQWDTMHRWVWVSDNIRINAQTSEVTVYNMTFDATDLTRKIVATASVEERLLLYPSLMAELSRGMDYGMLAAAAKWADLCAPQDREMDPIFCAPRAGVP